MPPSQPHAHTQQTKFFGTGFDMADVIKIGAVATAVPRLIVAMLHADGFELPASWVSWFLPLSAILSVGMAILEGLAFVYIFQAWRNQKDKSAVNLLYLAGLSAMLLTIVVSPSVAASIEDGTPFGNILSCGGPSLCTSALRMGWSAAVVLTSVFITASIGYAQKDKGVAMVAQAAPAKAQTQTQVTEQPAQSYECWCGYTAGKQNQLAAHTRTHYREASASPNASAVLEALKAKYPQAWAKSLESPEGSKFPTLIEIAKWRQEGEAKAE